MGRRPVLTFAISAAFCLLGAGLIAVPASASASAGVARHISAGERHTCALTTGGALDCWGANSNGDGQANDQPGPYTQIATGFAHTCALTPAGAAECQGENAVGQAKDQPGPYTQISAGSSHTCGLTRKGAVDCWGGGLTGGPVHKKGPYTVVTSGIAHPCALTRSRAADCWGRDEYSESTDQVGPYGPAATRLSIKTPRRAAKGTEVKITGVLKSPEAACVAAQEVTLDRGANVLSTRSTDVTGSYGFLMKIKREVRVRVVY